MKEKGKQSYTWIALGILMVLLYFGWYQFNSAIKEAEMYAEGLNYIEYLNSSTQRVVKLELENSPNDELIYHLENIMEELAPEDIYENTLFRHVSEIDDLIEAAKSDWDAIADEIKVVRNGGDKEVLLFASERHYNTTTELAITTTEKFTQASERITIIQVMIMILIGLISLIIFRHLYMAFLTIRHTRELSERMFIDVSTGLYNRSKCQEMLKDTNTPANTKSRIMIMVDLNDLKITNDKLGHQIGDELISSFASILRKAKDIHNFDVFVGRYGGDEFMIYYQSAEEADAKLYLEEVNYLIEAFNIHETRFQISYAAGYAVFTKEQDTLTMRDLFNAADEEMYKNKVAMKEARRLRQYEAENKASQEMKETQGGGTDGK